MRTLNSLGLTCDGKKVWVLDQTLLPGKKEWIDASQPEVMVDAIHRLQVRGAPLIGVAAAMSLAWYAEQGATQTEFLTAAKKLREARPTAVNLMHAIDRMVQSVEGSSQKLPSSEGMKSVVALAETIFTEDVELCARIARYGSEVFQKGDRILTHCNTGGLATAGVGTALGVIRAVYEKHKDIHVYADETRPLLQGGRLTAWECQELGIPYTLICDNMAAILMREKKITKVIVGSDRIAKNGDFANKVGTYSVAVLAKHHGIPFYVAAPVTTVDIKTRTGADIPIENRNSAEVRGVQGSFGSVTWAPVDAQVFNPAFDVTPAELVTGWILDKGVLSYDQVKSGAIEKLV